MREGWVLSYITPYRLSSWLIVEEGGHTELGECVDDVTYPASPTQNSLRNGLLLGVEINKSIWVSYDHRGSWAYQNHIM